MQVTEPLFQFSKMSEQDPPRLADVPSATFFLLVHLPTILPRISAYPL